MADRNPEDGLTIPREEIPGLPQFGWRVSLDYKCDEKCKPFQAPRLSQIVSLAGLGLRYVLVILQTYSTVLILGYYFEQ